MFTDPLGLGLSAGVASFRSLWPSRIRSAAKSAYRSRKRNRPLSAEPRGFDQRKPMQRRSPLTALRASVPSRRFEIRSINNHGRSRASGENSAKLAARRLCVDRERSDDSSFDENYVPATLNLAQSFLDRRSYLCAGWIYIDDTRIDTGKLWLKPVFAIFLCDQRMHGVFRLTGNAQISGKIRAMRKDVTDKKSYGIERNTLCFYLFDLTTGQRYRTAFVGNTFSYD